MTNTCQNFAMMKILITQPDGFRLTATCPDEDLFLIARFMGPTWGHLGPTGPRWDPCWLHEPCYLGLYVYDKLRATDMAVP